MLPGSGSGVGQVDGPRIASGVRVRVLVGAGAAWSGQVGQGAEAGEDLGEQICAGWEAQGEAAGVADQAGGDGDQPPPQGGDHGLATADTVPDQPPVWLLVIGGGGEVVQPSGEGGGEQR